MSYLGERIRNAAWVHGNQLRKAEVADEVAAEIARSLGPSDDEIRALVKSVAQATVEFVAENYDSPAELWAERKQVAKLMAANTMACAHDDPESEVHAMRGMRG